MIKSRILSSVCEEIELNSREDSRSDAAVALEHGKKQAKVKKRRSEIRNGLTHRQRAFILEKLVGQNDKNAALSAGYSLSVAENTKQRIWKPSVRQEFERLSTELSKQILSQKML